MYLMYDTYGNGYIKQGSGHKKIHFISLIHKTRCLHLANRNINWTIFYEWNQKILLSQPRQ